MGKCIFQKVEEIIEAVENIKKFVEGEKKVNPNRYKILEIQSRFTLDIPISDVTLKIGLNQRIVGQLQLTLQANVAAYAFAHKVYELQRSQAFSKIKTVFNYYEEYQQEFKELLTNQIKLFESESNNQFKETSEAVACFFQLSNLEQPIPKLRDYYQFEGLLTPKQNIFVRAIFKRVMRKQDEEKALFFKKYIRDEDDKKLDKTFNTVLFYQAIKDIDLTERPQIQQYKFIDQYFSINSILLIPQAFIS